MKKFFAIFAILALATSCAPELKPNGEFGEEKFVGKFHGVEIRRVTTPDGHSLYFGIKKDGEVIGTQVSQFNPATKCMETTPVIMVDGVKYIPETETKE